MAAGRRWTEDETKRALYLYFQTPFGRMHRGNPEIIELAKAIDRTPDSVAMKLGNFASLDPKITESGRKGLEGASALDREIWAEFQADWTRLVLEADRLSETHGGVTNQVREKAASFNYVAPSGPTTVRVEVEQRIGQSFFRRAVMANFENTCCVTGIADARLLNASHISPWQTDAANRHNPRNGLCLSATFDRAFDRGLMTITPELKVRLSEQLLNSASASTRSFFASYEGRPIRQATHLAPDPALLLQHNDRFLN